MNWNFIKYNSILFLSYFCFRVLILLKHHQCFLWNIFFQVYIWLSTLIICHVFFLILNEKSCMNKVQKLVILLTRNILMLLMADFFLQNSGLATFGAIQNKNGNWIRFSKRKRSHLHSIQSTIVNTHIFIPRVRLLLLRLLSLKLKMSWID